MSLSLHQISVIALNLTKRLTEGEVLGVGQG